ncbi:hypothetical protein JVT61DRAFT_1610 [Boletus reticuloceps]|uniref:Uncharacterized protein n=1 Tax=Boletus reticuloceps TaxID=495285 RepID=A0A8I2YTW7_9AGAM|nr:hypothetical protein JVT61DRAFT_1610 [Boletus reticuloceps]
MESLVSTSASFLTQPAPLTPNQRLPPFIPSQISPIRSRKYSQLLADSPQNYREAALHDALQVSEVCKAAYKKQLLDMQSSALLVGMYSDHLHGQLAAQQDKQNKRKTGHLNADGLPKLLSGDEFFKRVEEHEVAAQTEAVAQESRKKQ